MKIRKSFTRGSFLPGHAPVPPRTSLLPPQLDETLLAEGGHEAQRLVSGKLRDLPDFGIAEGPFGEDRQDARARILQCQPLVDVVPKRSVERLVRRS
jgi:hypothetical protein